MKIRIPLPLVFGLITASAQSQITYVGSLPTCWEVHSLASVGKKLIGNTSTTATIYNLDTTVYLTWTLPPLDPPFQHNGDLVYVTEALFDQDPATIEYVEWFGDTTGQFQFDPPPPPAQYGFRIVRTDGTVLFHQFPGSLATRWASGGLQNLASPIFTEAGVTYMLVQATGVNNRKLYTLPGSLPCNDCSDLMLGDGGGQVVSGNPGMGLFPNPANSSATITYAPLSSAARATIAFTDPDGRLIMRRPADRSGSMSISTLELPAGTYFFQLEVDGQWVGARRLVVVH